MSWLPFHWDSSSSNRGAPGCDHLHGIVWNIQLGWFLLLQLYFSNRNVTKCARHINYKGTLSILMIHGICCKATTSTELPVWREIAAGAGGFQCRYDLKPCIRYMIGIRGMTVGAENNKMWLAREAGWLIRFRFYYCSLLRLRFIVFITRLITRHSSTFDCIWEKRE